jgi:hypothetical protein
LVIRVGIAVIALPSLNLRPLGTFTMKQNIPNSFGKLKAVPKRLPDRHDWELFDNFPGLEIFEFRICRRKKFADLKTGRESFES